MGTRGTWLLYAGIMQNKHQPDKPYMLVRGEMAVSRLDLLERIFGPATRHLLSAAGLCSGMRIAEIGCGIGLTAQWASTQVSPGGSVVGVDSSSEQLHIGKKSAAEAGTTNLSFREGNAYETGLPRGSFDLVYSRFLLCHLADPAKALAEMSSLLRCGGILVCEDHDDGGIFTEPATHAYKRLVEISDAVNRSHGLDSSIGLRLPRLFREVGFSQPEARVNQIALLRGDAVAIPPGKEATSPAPGPRRPSESRACGNCGPVVGGDDARHCSELVHCIPRFYRRRRIGVDP